MMPHDLPPWQTVYSYFRRWERKGVWQKIHTVLRYTEGVGFAYRSYVKWRGEI